MLIGPDDSLVVAEGVMTALRARQWPVVRDKRLLGMLSLEDLRAARAVTDPRPPVTAGEIMKPAVVKAHPEDDLAIAAEWMSRHRVWCLPVVRAGVLVGVVTIDHFVEHAALLLRQEEYEFRFAPTTARLMTDVPLCTIEPREPVVAAVERMRRQDLRHLLVMNDDQLVGVLSQRDLLERLPAVDAARWLEVGEIMSSAPETISPDTDAASAAELLLGKHIGALPVLADGRVVGILTKSDFLRYVVAQQATSLTAGSLPDEHDARVLSPVQTVLVVEDDAAILSSLADVIRDDGYVVDTAANGNQALARLEACAPDLIFLDLMMPQLDGWGFLARLRALATARQVPIVLISALPNLAKEAERLGIPRFLQKPFELESVMRITHECCRIDQEAG
jgi:CBS domain-containing protein